MVVHVGNVGSVRACAAGEWPDRWPGLSEAPGVRNSPPCATNPVATTRRRNLSASILPRKEDPVNLIQLIAAAVLMSVAALAHALDIQPYTAGALAEAQKADKPVALHFHADWCPTCKAQEKVLQTLKAEPGLDLTVLVANYDTEKALKQRFNIRGQSTFVVLRGQQERGRVVGETTPAGIRSVLKTAL